MCDGIVNSSDGVPHQNKMEIIAEQYDRTHHIGIKRLPVEEIKEFRWEGVVNNVLNGAYGRRFKKNKNREV